MDIVDINSLRIAATVACFVVFVAILVWTFSRRRKTGFDDAAHIPFNDD